MTMRRRARRGEESQGIFVGTSYLLSHNLDHHGNDDRSIVVTRVALRPVMGKERTGEPLKDNLKNTRTFCWVSSAFKQSKAFLNILSCITPFNPVANGCNVTMYIFIRLISDLSYGSTDP